MTLSKIQTNLLKDLERKATFKLFFWNQKLKVNFKKKASQTDRIFQITVKFKEMLIKLLRINVEEMSVEIDEQATVINWFYEGLAIKTTNQDHITRTRYWLYEIGILI